MKHIVRFFQRLNIIAEWWGAKNPYANELSGTEKHFSFRTTRAAARFLFPPTGPTFDEISTVKPPVEEEPWCACDIPGDFRDDGAVTTNPSTGAITGCNGHCVQCGGRDWRPWCSED